MGHCSGRIGRPAGVVAEMAGREGRNDKNGGSRPRGEHVYVRSGRFANDFAVVRPLKADGIVALGEDAKDLAGFSVVDVAK